MISGSFILSKLQLCSFLTHFFQSDSYKEEIQKVFQELLEHISNLEPCEALYPLETSRNIYCTTEKMCHGSYHRSSEKVWSNWNTLTKIGVWTKWRSIKVGQSLAKYASLVDIMHFHPSFLLGLKLDTCQFGKENMNLHTLNPSKLNFLNLSTLLNFFQKYLSLFSD